MITGPAADATPRSAGSRGTGRPHATGRGAVATGGAARLPAGRLRERRRPSPLYSYYYLHEARPAAAAVAGCQTDRAAPAAARNISS